jgi:type IV pilus biogenesis protein CpaD/CtpE
MTRRSVRRTRVLCLVSVLAIAGCAHRGNPPAAPTSAAVPVGVTTTAPAATPSPDAAVDQQVSSIDDQLNTINGQLSAANAGLSSSEGNPAQ